MGRKTLWKDGIQNTDYVICKICNKKLRQIHHRHLQLHDTSLDEYKKMFPNELTVCTEYSKLTGIANKNRYAMMNIISYEFMRFCPKCKKILTYKDKKRWVRANKTNSLCCSCVKIGKPASDWFMNYLRTDNPSWKDDIKKKIGDFHRGRKRSDETKYKMSIKALGRVSPRKGVKLSSETKRKCRESRIKYIKKHYNGQICVAYNNTACKYFDWLNKWNGWNGIHALNGGEKQICGYFLDYYESILNIAIEWDEEYHYKGGKLVDKDIIRQNEIIKELNCDFYRIRQKDMSIQKIKGG